MPSSTVTLPPDNWTALVSGDSRPEPVRHINIYHTSQSIKGQYAISPLAEDLFPPRYDLPTEVATSNNTSSATFETKNSAIGVKVWILGNDTLVREPKEAGKKVGKPVSVYAKTYIGHIKVEVPLYTNPLPLYIRAKSHNGNVHIHIPPTFSGLLRWTCESGQFRASKSVMARYTTVGEQKKHRGVGKIRPAEWVQNKEERGDSAELLSTNGGIMLYDAGEESNSSACTIA
ncbi:hypothetical protein CBS101457_005992 [Exobasidium rhododendri]|nr:hypothetical protein CBS101457_005992 [Exobasidium rhododendri]